MAERDYKKEYAKFQASPQKKKYRAELNKYNRSKGTYGNGDGKDASHKGGKISGYEAEGKNRGRREKSRLKGSNRKTEGVAMPTLREFIIREATAEMVERLSKRWNIVDSVGSSWGGDGDDGGSVVNAREIQQAVEDGDTNHIMQCIKQVVSLRRKGTIDASSDNTLKKLLRIFIHVRKKNASMNEMLTITEKGDASWGGPDVKASELQAKELEPESVPENLTEGVIQPKCSNCQFFENTQGQKGHCLVLTPPNVVQSGWCKYWSHWDSVAPRFQSNLIRHRMRVGKAGAQYTNRAPNKTVTEDVDQSKC